MSQIRARARHIAGGALISVLVGLPALADDIEIYQNQQASQGVKPNVLFIMDTSGSMDTQVDAIPVYDPATDYGGSCADDRIYFSTNDSLPTCDTDNSFPVASNSCDAARIQLGAGGGGMWPAFGNVRERLGQYRGTPAQWQSLDGGESGRIECYADDSRHGVDAASTDKFIQNNGGDGWGATNAGLWNTAALNNQTYRLYSGNYLNYRNTAGKTPITMTRLQIVRDVAISLAGSLQNVNLGLMRYDSGAQGGMVLNAVNDIAVNRTGIINTLRGFNPDSGNGFTPLSETLFEAALYLRGSKVDYGNSSSPTLSVDASRNPNDTSRYNSPIDYQCQKNFVVYLTDGLPTQDNDANDKYDDLVPGGSCDDPDAPESSGWEETDGRCADDFAQYLYNNDLSPLPGRQTASTYMIGFGTDVANSVTFLNDVATAGGTGNAYTASNTADLTEALQRIFSRIQKQGSTFSTPSLTINAFNRTQTSNDLYFSVFQPDDALHWFGNLKKYSMRNGAVVDFYGRPALDNQGFFAQGTRSFWSDVDDGEDVMKGGAAGELINPQQRKLYTYLSANADLTAAGNLFNDGNLNDRLVGAGTSTTSCSDACDATIDWARGFDVTDIDGDRNLTEAARMMGDPLHGRPGVVSYGGTTADRDADDVVVFVPTNDGFLHAIEGKEGKELWAFIPPSLLSRLTLLRENGITASRSYGLDGDIRVLKFDKNQDGVVTASDGDYVWLFFGMRAGGNRYYALDVTNKAAPRLKWDIGPERLPGVGQTWSPPAITRVQIGEPPAQPTDPKFVLIFGGGYDTTQESQSYAADNVGNRIYMVDADTGARLWYAGGPTTLPGAGTPTLQLPNMTNSIPAAITVIDTNGDSFADRMYAGDMGGRVWRFDIFNGRPAASLVSGGVLARLGAGDNSGATAADARRFYNAPDVALIRRTGQDPYYNIAMGSGYRGHPLDTVTEEYFYSIRDRRPYARLEQNQYNFDPIEPRNLTDLTDSTAEPPTVSGWKIRTGASGSGEKVLAEAVTFNNVVLFTTFQPAPPSVDNPCYPRYINRVYGVYATTGKPALDFNGDGAVTFQDRSYVLKQSTGIVGEVVLGFDRSTGNQNDPNKSPGQPDINGRVGTEKLKATPRGDGTTRTFWQRTGAP